MIEAKRDGRKQRGSMTRLIARQKVLLALYWLSDDVLPYWVEGDMAPIAAAAGLSISATRRGMAELEGIGILERGLEGDGRRVLRTSISPGRSEFGPPPIEPPVRIRATPATVEPHWVDGVRFRVMGLLRAVATEGEAILPERLRRVASRVQAELAGSDVGNASGRFLALAEAVAHGYDPAIVDEALARAGEGPCPRCRSDIRSAIWGLTPDPKDWLWTRRNGRPEWQPRASQTAGWY